MNTRHTTYGFTLIEVLLVIAILAVLAAIAIIAINPQRQLASARDAERVSSVYAILSAMHQYSLDHEGTFPGELTDIAQEICLPSSESCEGLYDLSELTENEEYLVEMPVDPLCVVNSEYCNASGTGYFIGLTEGGGRIQVSAPNVELKDEIVATQ